MIGIWTRIQWFETNVVDLPRAGGPLGPAAGRIGKTVLGC